MLIKNTESNLLKRKCIESAPISESSKVNLHPEWNSISSSLTQLLLLVKTNIATTKKLNCFIDTAPKHQSCTKFSTGILWK